MIHFLDNAVPPSTVTGPSAPPSSTVVGPSAPPSSTVVGPSAPPSSTVIGPSAPPSSTVVGPVPPSTPLGKLKKGNNYKECYPILKFINTAFALSDDEDNTALVARIGLLVKAVQEKKLSLYEALESSAVTKIKSAIDSWRDIMEHNHQTAKLWLQYQRMIQILRSFLRSIRTGDWKLYLKSLCDMHPYLAAAGHNNYTKSLALFIPRMQDLERTHPEVNRAFMSGLFPVRRTEGAWCGMFTDLFIEQVLMAGLKTSGGLTRGRGFSESTRLLFLLSRPICSEISQCVFEIAGLSPDDENGHCDLTAYRINRDMSDIRKLVEVFNERGVFNTSFAKLVSLSTGLIADDSVNADDAKSVGAKILQSMVGETVSAYSFSQKNQVKTLASAVYVKTPSGGQIELDPQHLYQRLLLMGVGDIPLSELLGYELCSLPAALFDNYMRMRTGDKAELIHHLVKLVPESVFSTLPSTGLRYVIDGGGLLHKFAWPKNSTYAEICTLYLRHVSSSYANVTVVFDGYHGPSAKDEAHHRRSSNDVGAKVSVTKEMRLTMSKKAFLGNSSNKQALIYLLADEMSRAGIHVEHATGDADYKICQRACAYALGSPVAVVAEDSDVFQLLVHHTDPAASDVYMVAAKRTVCASTIKRRVDVQLSESLLFLHAVSGCDTTSRPHGIGKVGVLKKYAALAESAATFMASESSKVALETAGERALLIMYGSQVDDLKTARLQRFQTNVATALDMYHQRSFRRHQTPPDFTVTVSFSRYKHGKGTIFLPRSGDGQDPQPALFLCRCQSQQPQRSSCETSDVIVVADVIHDLAPPSRTAFSVLQRAANVRALHA